MKGMEIWVKSALRAYGSLDRVADTLDKLLMNVGLKGFNYLGDVTIFFDKMLDIVKRKERIVNLKVLIDSVFDKMDDKLVDVLRLRYVQDCKYLSIADMRGVCLKTAFRRCTIAMETFEEICLSLGCDKRWFEQYVDDPLVGKIYEKCRKQSLVARVGRSKSWTEEELKKHNSLIARAEHDKVAHIMQNATSVLNEQNSAKAVDHNKNVACSKQNIKLMSAGCGA